jgi:NAD(P)-dependent dehydrogenase (short-subunit alcohol dehydrogenase family)
MSDDSVVVLIFAFHKIDSVKNAIDETLKKWGRLSAAISCAGVAAARKVRSFST